MVRKKNVLQGVAEAVPAPAHEGRGEVLVFRPFAKGDFMSRCHFIDYAVLPPGTSIGVHRHSNDNEEVYFICHGRGEMQVDRETIEVTKGDVIINRPGGLHGLQNVGRDDLHLFVIECFM